MDSEEEGDEEEDEEEDEEDEDDEEGEVCCSRLEYHIFLKFYSLFKFKTLYLTILKRYMAYFSGRRREGRSNR